MPATYGKFNFFSKQSYLPGISYGPEGAVRNKVGTPPESSASFNAMSFHDYGNNPRLHLLHWLFSNPE